MNNSINNTFCILPWIHLNIWPNGDVYQCCTTEWKNSCGNTKKQSLEEIWNNDYLKSLRKSMLNGTKHPSCDRCYLNEELGLDSFRKESNKNFASHIKSAVEDTNIDGEYSKFNLIYWDFRFSNICNFKCRMCGSRLSSSWYDDHLKLNESIGGTINDPRLIHIDNYSKKSIKEYLLEFIDVVEEIYFAGGEPLLMDEHYFILEELINRNRNYVKLRYNTNISKLEYKGRNIIDFWKYFENNLSVYASIDGSDRIGEYIRSGTNWKIIEKNIKTILDFNPSILGISTTTQIFNIFNIPLLVDKLLLLGVPHDKILINNILNYPNYYNIQILPKDIKIKIEEKFRYHINCLEERFRNHFNSQYQGIIEFMNSPHNLDNEFLKLELVKITKQLDTYRLENYEDILEPDLIKWMNSSN